MTRELKKYKDIPVKGNSRVITVFTTKKIPDNQAPALNLASFFGKLPVRKLDKF